MLAKRLAEALGAEIVSSRRVAGGDVNRAYRVELATGRVLFAKTHPCPPEGFFTTEALSLEWLRKAGAVAVPRIIAHSDGKPGFLAMQWIEPGDRFPESDGWFGRELAMLHRAGAPGFGRDDRRTTGSRSLPNEPCATWVEFYVTQRLEPLRRMATDTAALPPKALAGIDRVISRIDFLAGPREPAARLHGDLWGGNRMVDREGRNWVVDPAAHGGHREFDLAMMRLFGGFSETCFDAYDELFPVSDGWTKRLPLHQLAPLIVHAIKFGGHFVGRVEQALLQLR
jgi:fructosamine-3-kinase